MCYETLKDSIEPSILLIYTKEGRYEETRSPIFDKRSKQEVHLIIELCNGETWVFKSMRIYDGNDVDHVGMYGRILLKKSC